MFFRREKEMTLGVQETTLMPDLGRAALTPIPPYLKVWRYSMWLYRVYLARVTESDPPTAEDFCARDYAL